MEPVTAESVIPQPPPVEAEDEPRRTLRLLARGVDPQSGQPLEGDGPLQRPEVIRALFLAVELLAGGRAYASAIAGGRRPRRPRRAPSSGTGSRWTPEEEQRLVAGFDGGEPLEALARQHARTRGAIRSRLIRLGKIEDEWLPPRRGG